MDLNSVTLLRKQSHSILVITDIGFLIVNLYTVIIHMNPFPCIIVVFIYYIFLFLVIFLQYVIKSLLFIVKKINNQNIFYI